MRILLVAGLADSLITFRGPLIAAMLSRGAEVHVAAPGLLPGSELHARIRALGVHVHDIHLRRTTTDPISDFRTLLDLWRLMIRIKPTHFLGYTIKPVIYGSLAAWASRVPRRYSMITGLGYAFIGERSLLQNLVVRLYRLALGRNATVFFQNPDDQELFRARSILEAAVPSVVLNGSGVDLQEFTPAPLPPGPPVFLLIARLLGDKGVREYAAAARRIRASFPAVSFLLAGWIDENPDAISPTELDGWIADGTLIYLGRLSDVRPAIARCSVYVLPSYREGTPRTVLEAMAMSRAVITTDAPGCRETVVDQHNGFLVAIKSVDQLEQAMRRFLDDPSLVTVMASRSRALVERKYDVREVNDTVLRGMGLE